MIDYTKATRVGFTGTRKGMTDLQKAELRTLLAGIGMVEEFHHGDCVGADAEAHEIAYGIAHRIIVHPPVIKTAAKGTLPEADKIIVLPDREYLDRNANIVEACDLLIVAPAYLEWKPRSGTWSTYNKARRRGILCAILDPYRIDP